MSIQNLIRKFDNFINVKLNHDDKPDMCKLIDKDF